MSSEQVTSDIIIPAFFLNFDDGHWWEFKDAATGRPSRVECHASESKMTVRISLGTDITEQVLEFHDIPDSDTAEPIRQYTLLESRMAAQHLTINWQGGLVLPPKMRAGTTLSATSQPGANPVTGNAVKIVATLASVGVFKPPALPVFGCEIKQVIKDAGLGVNLMSVNMYFAGGRGLVYATGDLAGVSFVLQPTRWYGQP